MNSYRNVAISEQKSSSDELTESQEDYTQPSVPEVEKYELTNTAPINKIHIK